MTRVFVIHMTDNTALFHLFFQVSYFSLQGSWRNQDIAFFSHCYLAFAASSVRLVLSCCCVSFKIIDAIYVKNVNVIFFKIPPVLIWKSYPGLQAFMIRLRVKNCGRVKMERHKKLRDPNENILVPSSLLFRQGIEEWTKFAYARDWVSRPTRDSESRARVSSGFRQNNSQSWNFTSPWKITKTLALHVWRKPAHNSTEIFLNRLPYIAISWPTGLQCLKW